MLPQWHLLWYFAEGIFKNLARLLPKSIAFGIFITCSRGTKELSKFLPNFNEFKEPKKWSYLKNFTLCEATRSSKAIQREKSTTLWNTKTRIEYGILRKECTSTVRDKVGHSVPYNLVRCPLLNKAGWRWDNSHLQQWLTLTSKTIKQSFALVLVALKDLRIPLINRAQHKDRRNMGTLGQENEIKH